MAINGSVQRRRLMMRLAGTICLLLLSFTFILLASQAAIAADDVSEIAAVSGNFIYSEWHQGATVASKPNALSYQVNAVSYHGIPAWRITLDCPQIRAEHYIRSSDGAPLYAKRVNQVLHRTVEITYSLDAKKPHIYRRRSKNEYFERKIYQTNLRDLGALPQVLLGFQASGKADEMSFKAINYNDGKVYELVAKRVGYHRVQAAGQFVRCAIYMVNLDSWKAAFNKPMRVLIPTRLGQSNFAVYMGPNPAGTGKLLTLRLVDKSLAVASLENRQ